MMPVVKETFTLPRPLFDVFKVATDFEQYPTLLKGVRDIHITSGDPLRAGSMVSMVRDGIFINADVLDFQRHKAITLQGVWGRFRFTRKQEFVSTGSGSTQVTDAFEVHMGFLVLVRPRGQPHHAPAHAGRLGSG
jgi:carbon monoxide dehydrogenase subunit G